MRGGGPAAGGSFGQAGSGRGSYRGGYYPRGPAAYGNLGGEAQRRAVWEAQRQAEWDAQRQAQWEANREQRYEARQDRREARQDEDWDERRENWEEFVEDRDDGYYYGGYFYDDDYGDGASELEEGYYWSLPCRPTVMAMRGTTYYVCGADWYERVYLDGEVVFALVPNPNGN